MSKSTNMIKQVQYSFGHENGQFEQSVLTQDTTFLTSHLAHGNVPNVRWMETLIEFTGQIYSRKLQRSVSKEAAESSDIIGSGSVWQE